MGMMRWDGMVIKLLVVALFLPYLLPKPYILN